jgi:8-oxo-dGTP pyrophosphatase MutT (NUDIX family)
MSNVGRTRSSTFRDAVWRAAFRLGFPLARLGWRARRPRHEGAIVAIYVGERLLVVRSSYRNEWNFPGGGIRYGEAPEAAARRELNEELGLEAHELAAAGEASGIWEERRDHVHFFELRFDRLPELLLDNREITAAWLAPPGELRGAALTGPVVAYLDRALARHAPALNETLKNP